MTINWWENFFHGVALDFWRAAVSEDQTRNEAAFIHKHLAVESGAEILDVPCGNGRLSLALAERGLHPTGVDIASEFIEEAKAASAARGINMQWHQRDMRDLPWPGSFEGAFCFGNSFGYLDDEGNVSFLRSISTVLRPHGRFILDAPAIAECLLPNLKKERSIEIAGITMKSNSRYDPDKARLFTEYTFIRDGVDDKRLSSQRIYTYRELVSLLQSVGLSIQAAYSSLSDEPFVPDSPRLLLITSKV